MLRRASSELLDNQGVDEMVTWRAMKERRLRQASHTWRKEGAKWKEEPEEFDDEFIANLKLGKGLAKASSAESKAKIGHSRWF